MPHTPTGQYPWDPWLARRTPLRLVRGKHYHCQPHSMSVQVRRAARLRGLVVRVHIDDDVVTVFPTRPRTGGE